MSLFYQNSPALINPPEDRTLFLGDLSVYCTEEEIGNFFRPFGIIEKIRIKHATNNKNLSYGFVTFANRETAERVLQQANGQIFLGRTLRLGWASHKDKSVPQPFPKQDMNITSAQIHVSFLSKQVDVLITEITLRSLFSRFGEVADVAIKKIQFNPRLRLQNGYGFVHFHLTQDGINAAIAATNLIRQYTIDRVTYDSCLTRSLEYVIETHKGSMQLLEPIQGNSRVQDAKSDPRYPQDLIVEPPSSFPMGQKNPYDLATQRMMSIPNSVDRHWPYESMQKNSMPFPSSMGIMKVGSMDSNESSSGSGKNSGHEMYLLSAARGTQGSSFPASNTFGGAAFPGNYGDDFRSSFPSNNFPSNAGNKAFPSHSSYGLESTYNLGSPSNSSNSALNYLAPSDLNSFNASTSPSNKGLFPNQSQQFPSQY